MKYVNLFKLITFFLVILFILIVSFNFSGLSLSLFVEIFSDKLFLSALKFGFLTATVATILSCVFGIPAGFYLARSKGKVVKILDSFFDIPIMIPPLIMGVFLLNFFNKSYLNNFFEIIFTFKGAVFAQFLISFPFTLKMAKSSFELVPPIYERIAMTLGAGYFRSFYDTTFKIALSGILSGVLLSWLRSFGEFGATLLVAGGISGKTANLPIYIYLNIIQGDYEKGVTASIITIVIILVMITVIKGTNIRKENIE
jgi:molybdate transport system permease protein